MKNDSATKADLKKTADGLHQEISGVETRLKARLTETKNELQKEMAAFKNDLHEEIAAVKTELREEIAAVKTELREEIATTKTELRDEIATTKTELRDEIATVKTELNSKIDSFKDVLDRRIEHVAVALVQVSADLHEFKQETRKQHHEVLTAMDGLAGMATDMRTEIAAFNHAFNRHEKTIEDHESRIGLLEGKNL
jgi:archaellum component FlaC